MDLAVSIAIGLTVIGSAIVTLPNLIVEWARRSDPEVVFSVDTGEPWVALTIDDVRNRSKQSPRPATSSRTT
jgi:hypothetical protein